MHCKTCQYWTGPFVDGFGSCDLAVAKGQPQSPQTLAWAEDYEGYGANLRTRPEFGCILWEEGKTP